jgi:hypothetical protein
MMPRMRWAGGVGIVVTGLFAAACGLSTAGSGSDVASGAAATDPSAGTNASAGADGGADAKAFANANADAGGGGVANGDGGADASANANADDDGDGIPDATEAMLAAEYMPFVSIHPNDGCRVHGLLYRLSPHPKDPKRLTMWVDVLYNEDCGANGHPGDDEMFSVAIDPTKPGANGILAVRGISHQGTPCEHDTTCGVCNGMTACSTGMKGGAAYPAVYPSKDKHGNYADMGTCSGSFICDFGGCALDAQSDDSPMVNAGEPGHPLVHDLTTDAFVTAANGWTESSLMHFDPWKPGIFGGAGDVSQDLVDQSYVIDVTNCP